MDQIVNPSINHVNSNYFNSFILVLDPDMFINVCPLLSSLTASYFYLVAGTYINVYM